MTDRVQPGAIGSIIENIELGEMTTQLTDGWIIPSDEPTLSAQRADNIDHTTFDEFDIQSSSESLEVTIQPGEAFIRGWVARDEPTTIELEPNETGQEIVLGWDPDAFYDEEIHDTRADADKTHIALASEVDDLDPYEVIWSVDTSNTGVTNTSDRRTIDFQPAGSAELNSLFNRVMLELARLRFESGLDTLDFRDGWYDIFVSNEWDDSYAVKWNPNDDTIELVDGKSFFDGIVSDDDTVSFGVNRDVLPDVEMTFEATDGDVTFPVIYFNEWIEFANADYRLADGESTELEIGGEQPSRLVVDIFGGIGNGDGSSEWLYEGHLDTVESTVATATRSYHGDQNGVVEAVDIYTGTEDVEFDHVGHDGTVNGLAHSVTDALLFSGGADNIVKATDEETGELEWSHSEHDASVNDLEYRYGLLVSVDSNGKVVAWDVESNSLAWSHTRHASSVTGVDIWRDYVFSGDVDGELRVVERDTGAAFRRFAPLDTDGTSITDISADDWTVFLSDDAGVVTAFDWFLEELTWEYTGHSSQVNTIHVNHGYVYTGSNDNSIRQLNASDGLENWVQGHHSLNVNSVHEFNGVLVSGGTDNDVYGSTVLQPAEEPELTIGEQTVSTDETISASRYRDVIEVDPDSYGAELSLLSGEAIVRFQWTEGNGVSRQTERAGVSDGDRLPIDLAGTTADITFENTTEIEDFSVGSPLWSHSIHEERPEAVFEYEDLLISGSARDENKVVAVNKNTGEKEWEHTHHSDTVYDIYANDGIVVSTSFSGSVIGANASDGSEIWSANPHDDGTDAVTGTGSRVFTGGRDNIVRELRLSNGSEINSHSFHSSSLRTIVVAGDLLISDSGNEIVAVNRESFSLVYKIEYDTNVNTDLTYNGERLFLVSLDDEAFSFDPETGEQLWKVDLKDRGRAVAASRSLVYVGLDSGDIQVLNPEDGSELFYAENAADDWFRDMRLFETRLYTASNDLSVKRFDVEQPLAGVEIELRDSTITTGETVRLNQSEKATLRAAEGVGTIQLTVDEHNPTWSPYFHYRGTLADTEVVDFDDTSKGVRNFGRTEMDVSIDVNNSDTDEFRATFEAPYPEYGYLDYKQRFLPFFADEGVGVADFVTRPNGTGVEFVITDENGNERTIDEVDELTEFAALSSPKQTLRLALTREAGMTATPVLDQFAVYLNGERVTEYMDIELMGLAGVLPGEITFLLRPGIGGLDVELVEGFDFEDNA